MKSLCYLCGEKNNKNRKCWKNVGDHFHYSGKYAAYLGEQFRHKENNYIWVIGHKSWGYGNHWFIVKIAEKLISHVCRWNYFKVYTLFIKITTWRKKMTEIYVLYIYIFLYIFIHTYICIYITLYIYIYVYIDNIYNP